MARTPSGAVTYASTRRRPPHLTQPKTSSAFRPEQQSGPIHSRRPLLLRFLLRLCLRPYETVCQTLPMVEGSAVVIGSKAPVPRDLVLRGLLSKIIVSVPVGLGPEVILDGP